MSAIADNRRARRGAISRGPMLACAVLLIWSLATPLSAAPDFPAPFGPATVDSLARAHRADGAVILQDLTIIDVRYDEDCGCLRGRITELREIVVSASARLADVGRVFVGDGPHRRLDDFRAEVMRPGGKSQRLKEGDLDWSAFTPAGGGVITLDRTLRTAVVPGLRRGDRLRTRVVYDLEAHHGVPPVQLGGGGFVTARARAEIRVPADHEVVWQALGPEELRDRLDVTTGVDGGRRTVAWELRDLPRAAAGFRYRSDDDGQVLVIPHVARVDGQNPAASMAVAPDWAAVARAYRGLVAETMMVTPEIAARATALTAGCADDAERIDALFGHLQATTRYLGLYTGLGGIIPEPAGEVLACGYGDCKGLGTLLIALLRAVDIDAWPVLVRTGHVGPLAEEVPNPIQFNHYIVWADDGAGGMWLDATQEGCPAGLISAQDAVSPVLSLRPGHEGLHRIPLAAWDPGEIRYDVQGALVPSGELGLRVAVGATGNSRVGLRAVTLRASREELDSLLDRRLRPVSVPMRTDGSRSELDADDRRAPVTWILEATTGRPLPGSGPLVFLPHVLPPLHSYGERTVPAREADRVENWTIALPPGWAVTADSTRVSGGALTWERRTWQDEAGRMRLERSVHWHRDARRSLAQDEETAAALAEAEAAERGYITITRTP